MRVAGGLGNRYRRVVAGEMVMGVGDKMRRGGGRDLVAWLGTELPGESLDVWFRLAWLVYRFCVIHFFISFSFSV